MARPVRGTGLVDRSPRQHLEEARIRAHRWSATLRPSLVAVTAGLLLLSGCGGGGGNGAAGNGSSPRPTVSTPTITPTPLPSSTPSASAGAGHMDQRRLALAVITTAQHAVHNGKVFHLERDVGQSRHVWITQVAGPGGNQFQVIVSANGEQVLARRRRGTAGDDLARLRAATVSPRRAAGIAARRATGHNELSSLELHRAHGKLVWRVGFGAAPGTTVVVDAKTGNVLHVSTGAG